jgi:hypothetical protein
MLLADVWRFVSGENAAGQSPHQLGDGVEVGGESLASS